MVYSNYDEDAQREEDEAEVARLNLSDESPSRRLGRRMDVCITWA
jgi:hypothetical protein